MFPGLKEKKYTCTYTSIYILSVRTNISFTIYYNSCSIIYDITLLKYNAVVRVLNLFLRNLTKFEFGELTEMGPF